MSRQYGCMFHRYPVVYVIGDRIYDRAQGSWEIEMRGLPAESVETYASDLYEHGMTVDELRRAAQRRAA